MKRIPCVTLRAPEPEDLDLLYRWENDPKQWHNSLTPPLTSRFQLQRYIEGFSGDIAVDGSLRLVIEPETVGSKGVPAGTIDVCDFNRRGRSAFVSIYIDERRRGEGYGYAALSLLCDTYCEALCISNLGALIASDNTASQQLFSRAGFRKCGILPSWLGPEKDLLIYYRSLFF